MIPINLKISGFLSYQDMVEIDFQDFDLACISGANGSGKSSILDSITWALFGQARRRDDAIINLQSTVADVEFTFEFQKNVYRIQRIKQVGKSSVLEFNILNPPDDWNPLTERTLRATEAKIEEKLKLDYETFINASFFLQGKADQFTQQKPADRKRILGTILGLEVWDEYRGKAVEVKKQLNASLASIDGRLEEISTELNEEDARNNKLGSLQSQLDLAGKAMVAQKMVITSMKQVVMLRETQLDKIAKIDAQYKNEFSSRDDLLVKLKIREDESLSFAVLLENEDDIKSRKVKWEKTKNRLEKWALDANQYREHESKRHQPLAEIEKEKDLLQAEINRLTDLEQENATRFNDLPLLEKDQINAQEEIEQIHKSGKEKAALEIKKEVALKNQLKAEAENPILKEEMSSLKERIDRLEDSEGAICPICDQPLSAEEKIKLINNLRKEGKEKGDKFRENKILVSSTKEITENFGKQIKALDNIEVSLREKTRELDQIFINMEKILADDAIWKQKHAPKLTEILYQLNESNFAISARDKLNAIDAELNIIGYDAGQHDKMREQERIERTVSEELLGLEKAMAAMAPLTREINDINQQIKEKEKQIASLENDLKDMNLLNIQGEGEIPDVNAEERKISIMQEEENQLRLQVGGAKQEVEVLESLKIRRDSLVGEREEIGIQIAQYTQLEKAFGKDGIPAMLIEQALPQIQGNANKHLEKLGNGSMRIEFVTQQAYKDSKRKDYKETLDIHITDSSGKRDYEMFSGGEGFRINFAIRLALAEVLAQRAGAQLQLLVIDEGFGSQDQLGRQRLVEVINLIKPQFKKILVITHIDSLKDVFPTRIEVTKPEGQGSQIQIM